jgi:hypothetical protein
MEITYELVSNWFDAYFEQVHKNQGLLETVRNLEKFFNSDIELRMHTGPSQTSTRMSRDELLMSFVHPGLREDIVPRYYVIDLRHMIIVVQFEIRFFDEPSNKHWNPIQASAHYHLMLDENGDLRIRRIEYWTEALDDDIFEIWAQRRTEALTKHAMAYIVGQ